MTVHLTPNESGHTRCCGKLTCELPLSDEFSVDEAKVTCPWRMCPTDFGEMYLPSVIYPLPKVVVKELIPSDSPETYPVETKTNQV